MKKDYNKLINLISMLRELDLEKNDVETIRYVLNYIANELEKIIKQEEITWQN